MLVRDVMQREVATLKANGSLGLAEDIMRLGRIRHLPVGSAGVVVGIVSQRDLYRAAMSCMLQVRRSREREWLASIPSGA
jgi:CBS domain-containing protein